MKKQKAYLVISVFIVILFCLVCVGCIKVMKPSQQNYNADRLDVSQENCDTKYHGFEVNFSGSHYFIADKNDESDITGKISNIISRRDHDPFNISVSRKNVGYLYIRNLSQGTLNRNLKRTYYNDRTITGTCSLVAMTIMIDFVSRLENDMGDPLIEERSCYDIFKDLYDISYDVFGNRYGNPISEDENIEEYNMHGTPDSQVKPILLEYLEMQDISFPVVDKGYIYADGNKDAEKDYLNEIAETIMDSIPVVIVNINNFSLSDEGEIENIAHKIAVSGSITYNANYKIKPWYALWGVSRQENIYAFTFSNGWENAEPSEMDSVFIITDEARMSNIQYIDWSD